MSVMKIQPSTHD